MILECVGVHVMRLWGTPLLVCMISPYPLSSPTLSPHPLHPPPHSLAHPVGDREDRRHGADHRDVHPQGGVRHHDGGRVGEAVAGQVVRRVPNDDPEEDEQAPADKRGGVGRGLRGERGEGEGRVCVE